jgi:hypothetical protein
MSRTNSWHVAAALRSDLYSFVQAIFPPGRFRLFTRPSFTGSLPLVNKIGIVDVAASAARAG